MVPAVRGLLPGRFSAQRPSDRRLSVMPCGPASFNFEDDVHHPVFREASQGRRASPDRQAKNATETDRCRIRHRSGGLHLRGRIRQRGNGCGEHRPGCMGPTRSRRRGPSRSRATPSTTLRIDPAICAANATHEFPPREGEVPIPIQGFCLVSIPGVRLVRRPRGPECAVSAPGDSRRPVSEYGLLGVAGFL